MTKTFTLRRPLNDDDKVIVAYGCIFPNGKCVVSWIGKHQSVVVWNSYEDMRAVNGHADTDFILASSPVSIKQKETKSQT